MYKFLDKNQRQELLDELQIERSRRYADRIRVILLLDDNETYKNISKFLFLDEGSIANYRKRYKEGGLEGLVLDDYCTKRTRLNEFEEIQLIADLDAKIFASTKEVVAHIEKSFKIKFSVSGCNNLLHRLGFSFKKAKGVPGKAKIEDQIDFIQKYDLIKAIGSKIYFGDATHPLHNTVLSSGWIKRGQEKEVFTNSGRSRVNIFGAISISELDVVTRSYDTINQFTVCDFLRALRAKNPNGEKLYFILDRGPSNKALSVKDLAKELNIEIVLLPPYSPNLNPIERLWKFFKKKVLYNKYYEKFKDFESVCASFFRGIRKYKAELATLITDNFSPVGT
jgi:transposase